MLVPDRQFFFWWIFGLLLLCAVWTLVEHLVEQRRLRRAEKVVGFKTRVRLFIPRGRFYVVEYSKDGGATWEAAKEALIHGDLDDWKLNQPLLTKTFEEAAELAKGFTTIEAVELHHRREQEKLRAAWEAKEAERLGRQKEWVSE